MQLSIGSILSNTFSIAGKRFLPLAGIWLIFLLAQIVLFFVMFGVVGASIGGAANMDNPLAAGIGSIFVLFILYIVYLLIYMAQSASMTHQASPAMSPSVGESLAAGVRSSPTLLGLLLIFIVAYFVFAILAGIVGFIFALMGDAGALLFGLTVFIAAIYLAARLSLTLAVVAIDGVRNPITALQRSWQLTEGHVIKIVAVLLLFVVLIVIFGFVVVASLGGSMAGLATLGSTDTAGLAGMGTALLGLIVLSILFGAALAVLGATFLGSLHAALAGPEAVADTFT